MPDAYALETVILVALVPLAIAALCTPVQWIEARRRRRTGPRPWASPRQG